MAKIRTTVQIGGSGSGSRCCVLWLNTAVTCRLAAATVRRQSSQSSRITVRHQPGRRRRLSRVPVQDAAGPVIPQASRSPLNLRPMGRGSGRGRPRCSPGRPAGECDHL